MSNVKIDWSRFVDLKYWLEGIAGTSSITPIISKDSWFFWFFTYFFATFLVAGIVLRVSQAFLHSENPFQKRFPVWGNNLISMGLLGLLWFSLREFSVGFLGARIWLLVGLIWFLVFLYFLIRYFIIFFQLEMAYFKTSVLPKTIKKT